MGAAVPWPQVRISGCISVGSLQDVESQAASVTFQLPRGHNAKSPKPEDWRAQALTCEVISSAERETARAPTERLDTLATNPVKPTQLTFLTQFSSEERRWTENKGSNPKTGVVLVRDKTARGQCRISVHSVDLGSLLDMDQFSCCDAATGSHDPRNAENV